MSYHCDEQTLAYPARCGFGKSGLLLETCMQVASRAARTS